MSEGRLSSDLQERYGISDKNAVGKVLWHSLNENGDIGVYDMKFGNTIVRNLLRENVEAVDEAHPMEEQHGVQEEGDAGRAALKEQ
tara:strand:- start:213 stop:470 length:258 start_codon:yes stop_codon:yes gene_type:complete